MMQRQLPLEGSLTACSCGKQPRRYLCQGRNLHFLECAPCGVSTRKYTAYELAVEEWEAGHRIEEQRA